MGHDCAQRFTADANNYIHSVAEAADVRIAAPNPRLVAPRPPRGDHANSATIRPARRLTIEATVNL